MISIQEFPFNKSTHLYHPSINFHLTKIRCDLINVSTPSTFSKHNSRLQNMIIHFLSNPLTLWRTTRAILTWRPYRYPIVPLSRSNKSPRRVYNRPFLQHDLIHPATLNPFCQWERNISTTENKNSKDIKPHQRTTTEPHQREMCRPLFHKFFFRQTTFISTKAYSDLRDTHIPFLLLATMIITFSQRQLTNYVH